MTGHFRERETSRLSPSVRKKGGSVNQALSYWTSTETVTNSYPLLVSWLTRCNSRLTIVVA